MSARHGDYHQLSGAQRARLTDRIWERDGAVCHICRLPVARRDASLDHIIPVSRGGVTIEDNLALAHRSCNYARQDKPLGATRIETHDGLEWFLDE